METRCLIIRVGSPLTMHIIQIMSNNLIPGGRFRHKLIEFLTKKPYRDHMRAPRNQAPRSIPQPAMPATENSAISANYYYDRDHRRKMGPPVSLLTKQIEAGVKDR